MATVKFSAELRKIITGNARRSLNPKLKKVEEIKSSIIREYGDKIYDTIFQEYADSIRNIPAGWVKTTKVIKINRVRDVYFNEDFLLSYERVWPFYTSKILKQNEYISEILYDDKLSLQDYPLFPVWEDLYQAICDYRRKLEDVRQEINSFEQDVTKIINSYGTLAPALKAWPPLWDLLPEEIKNKHRQIPQKRRSHTVDLDVNLDKLTAIATATKLGV
jgi:hypothetical protein